VHRVGAQVLDQLAAQNGAKMRIWIRKRVLFGVKKVHFAIEALA
jgi:hypothetical protein